MLAIRARLDAWSRGGAVFLGYNSIKFDEALLRQSYYQTLLPLYQTNTNGNARADVMRIVQACAIHEPGAIVIPTKPNGQPVFKLGLVAAANGIDLDNAHEALADARATLDLARIVKTRAPTTWTRMLANSRKQGILAILQRPVLCLSEVYFGRAFSFVVSEAARNPNDESDIALFDLRHDPEQFLDLSVADLLPWITGKVKVVRCIRPNSQPMLFQLEGEPAGIKDGLLAPEVYEHRADVIRRSAGFRERLGLALAQRFDDGDPSPHVEGRIFDGFPERADLETMAAFVDADWPRRTELASLLVDPRYRELAGRLIAAERPDLLADADRARHEEWVAYRLMTEDAVPWLTVPKAMIELEKLVNDETDPGVLAHLVEIEQFLNRLSLRCRSRASTMAA
jgi:exodeoxyribonuclease-1